MLYLYIVLFNYKRQYRNKGERQSGRVGIIYERKKERERRGGERNRKVRGRGRERGGEGGEGERGRESKGKQGGGRVNNPNGGDQCT